MAFGLASQAFAQNEVVTGTYTYNGEGVKGIKVWSSSSKEKVVETDKRGRFKVKHINAKTDTIFLSYLGKTVVAPLEGKHVVKVERKDSSLSVELLEPEKRPSGQYGGVILTNSDLKATGANYLKEAVDKRFPQRLFTSFNGSNQPLYFIDGVETTSLNGLTVDEVAYVEVVRPADPAASNWGSRGGNGAVLVTTKVHDVSTAK